MVIEIVLTSVIVILLAFVAWRDWQFNKLIEALTNKLLARDLPEYIRAKTVADKKDSNEQKAERRKSAVDPHLGSQF